jgi:hypothetical protein
MEKRFYASTWQDFLADLIADTQEKERLAAALSVEPITLTRWAKRIVRPRERHIHNLVQALPPSRTQEFLRLAQADFPSLQSKTALDHLTLEALPQNMKYIPHNSGDGRPSL